MFGDNLFVSISTIVLLIFSVVVHEFAHGWAALRAGDPTAKMMGRLTLNPIPHIDLFGSIIIPAFLIFSGSSFLFAYAKPVPVNPNNFRNYRNDEIKVSYEELLEIFWQIHDPTQINQQGPDIGSQYRSVIFYHDEEQKNKAEKSKIQLEGSKQYLKPIATEITKAKTFYKAEEYHQKYLQKNQ